jgi:DNA-nicking Smr family endonuclease
LKGLATPSAKSATRGESAPVHKKYALNDENEVSLFLRAAEGAKLLHQTPEGSGVPDKLQVPGKKDRSAPEDKQLFLLAMQRIGTTLRDTRPDQEHEEAKRRSPTSRMKQLKRGTLHIGQELDLHGFFKDEALMRLKHFIANAFS